MNNTLIHAYHRILTLIIDKIKAGEKTPEILVHIARLRLGEMHDLNAQERKTVLRAIRRDLAEFARQVHAAPEAETDSPFLLALKESLWAELADVTDKTQLGWLEMYQDIEHGGVYHSGDVVGLGELVCDRCQHKLVYFAPEVLPACPQCGGTAFHRRALQP